jgi:hypothetical protein
MKSRTTRHFWRLYKALPETVQLQARAAYVLFRDNPRHPSLHFKLVNSPKSLYSARVGLGYRTIGRIVGEDIIWFWIGSHSEYDQILG